MPNCMAMIAPAKLSLSVFLSLNQPPEASSDRRLSPSLTPLPTSCTLDSLSSLIATNDKAPYTDIPCTPRSDNAFFHHDHDNPLRTGPLVTVHRSNTHPLLARDTGSGELAAARGRPLSLDSGVGSFISSDLSQTPPCGAAHHFSEAQLSGGFHIRSLLQSKTVPRYCSLRAASTPNNPFVNPPNSTTSARMTRRLVYGAGLLAFLIGKPVNP